MKNKHHSAQVSLFNCGTGKSSEAVFCIDVLFTLHSTYGALHYYITLGCDCLAALSDVFEIKDGIKKKIKKTHRWSGERESDCFTARCAPSLLAVLSSPGRSVTIGQTGPS